MYLDVGTFCSYTIKKYQAIYIPQHIIVSFKVIPQFTAQVIRYNILFNFIYKNNKVVQQCWLCNQKLQHFQHTYRRSIPITFKYTTIFNGLKFFKHMLAKRKHKRPAIYKWSVTRDLYMHVLEN